MTPGTARSVSAFSVDAQGRTVVDVNPTSAPVVFRDSSQVQEIARFVGAQTGQGGAPLGASTSSLEGAARLAALRSYGYSEASGGSFGQASLETELLRNARVVSGSV